MGTEQERLARMHRRAGELQRKRDLSILHLWGSVSTALFLCLLMLSAAFPAGHGLTDSTSTASSLLSDSVGGYVLIGVLAFMLGVVITVALLRRRFKDQNDKRM